VEAGEIISDEELADAKSIVGWNDPCIYTASSVSHCVIRVYILILKRVQAT